MTEEEWNEYVDFASGGEWPIPRGMISDYNNWLCRSIVGRALYFRDKVEPAMTVLATVVEVEPSMEKAAKGMSEAEHKILCLRDIAKIIWGLTKNTEAALNYWDQAIALCARYQYAFVSVARGEISYGRLIMLVAAGQEEQACNEARAMTGNERFERDGIIEQKINLACFDILQSLCQSDRIGNVLNVNSFFISICLIPVF